MKRQSGRICGPCGRSCLVCLPAEKSRDFKLVVVDRGIDLWLNRHDVGSAHRGRRRGRRGRPTVARFAALGVQLVLNGLHDVGAIHLNAH